MNICLVCDHVAPTNRHTQFKSCNAIGVTYTHNSVITPMILNVCVRDHGYSLRSILIFMPIPLIFVQCVTSSASACCLLAQRLQTMPILSKKNVFLLLYFAYLLDIGIIIATRMHYSALL